MTQNLYALYSNPDGFDVIYVKAPDKKTALKIINETGGYQDEPMVPDCDYKILKRKKMDPDPWATEFITKRGRRLTMQDMLNEIDEVM